MLSIEYATNTETAEILRQILRAETHVVGRLIPEHGEVPHTVLELHPVELTSGWLTSRAGA